MVQLVGKAPGRWTGENLSTQGYRLSDAERRELWLGLRFPTDLCLVLVVAALALLFGAGQDTAALALGGVLLAVCGLVTVTSFCIPSTLLAWWERRKPRKAIEA